MTKIKHVIYKYNWQGINYPPERNGSEKIEKINLTIALKNMSCLYLKT